MGRGNERKEIYADDEERKLFLELLAKAVWRYGWDCLAYCLMRNHYHLVIRTPLPNLSRGMQLINGVYARRRNERRGVEGSHVFQGRFRSVVVRDAEHLLITLKYVLRNPVTAGLCEHPSGWLWSSYESTATATVSRLIAVEATLRWFGDDDAAGERFAGFICDSSDGTTEYTLAGDIEFPTEPIDADEPRPPVEALLASMPGEAGIARAYRDHGYSLADIGAALGCSRYTVGRRLVAYEAVQMLQSGV
jgi:putative transposase